MVLDFGATTVTGMHTLVVERLREHFGLDKHPVKVIEPYQFLGEVEADLQDALGVDVVGVFSPRNMFGHRQERWKEYRMPWGQVVLVPGTFSTSIDDNGNLLMYPVGDLSAPPSAKMPVAAYFFDALERQQPLDEMNLDPEDNLEEYSLISEEDVEYFRMAASVASGRGKGVIAGFGGTHIGNIAFVPGMALKNPRGIRSVAEWYMSILMRPDYLHQVFEKQSDIALQNLSRLHQVCGTHVDAVYLCGTDFGTQNSTFCSVETFNELFAPYYKKINNWIHANTPWKTFKHCCGAIEPLMDSFIASGFDIMSPVQISAAGMDSGRLKEQYGDRLVFWGGGIDTQKVLPYSSPEEVRTHVFRQCEIFAPGGGFVFNPVHNIQANVPIENVVAMWEAVREFKNSTYS
jgi:hypothetical protein